MSAFGTKRTFRGGLQCPLSGVKRTFPQLTAMSASNPKRTFGPVPYLHSNAIPEYYLDIKVSEKKQWICQSPNMPNRVRFTLLIRSSDQAYSIWCLCPAGTSNLD